MKFWVVRLMTERGFRYATYEAHSPEGAEVQAMRKYSGAFRADTVREEGAMERQVRETFGRMYGGKHS